MKFQILKAPGAASRFFRAKEPYPCDFTPLESPLSYIFAELHAVKLYFRNSGVSICNCVLDACAGAGNSEHPSAICEGFAALWPCPGVENNNILQFRRGIEPGNRMPFFIFLRIAF